MHWPRISTSTRRARRVIAIAVPVVLLCAGMALAWTIGTTNPSNAVTAATLGAASGVTPSTVNSCLTVTINWTAASQANDYLIEVKTDNGAYSTVIASTGNVTTYLNSTNRSATNRTYTYRVTPKAAGSSWTGTPSTGEIICGIGEVNDLAATNGCTNTPVTLTWSAAGGTATNYEIFRSVNGAAFTLAVGDIAALTWNDTSRTVGQNVAYYIIPQNAANANGNQSNTTPTLDVGFFLKSVAFANGSGVANSLGNGDSITATFSKATNGVLPGGAGANSIYIRATGGRMVWLASTANAAANTGIAGLPVTTMTTGTNAAHAGASSWAGGNTQWVWVRGAAAAVAYSAPTWTNGNVTLGTIATRVKCNNGTTNLTATNPVESGWF